MREILLTLTTDFGTGSSYVATLKGVLLGINPALRLVDISHDIPAQNIRHAAFMLADCLPYFPRETLHVIVVDPGVGTARAVLHIEAGGHQLLAPDNGCWTRAAERFTDSPCVRRLTERRFWRHPVSDTFHGRDIFAPVAAHLSLGLPADELGPLVSEWVRLKPPGLTVTQDRAAGEVVFIDTFGNLLTSIPEEVFARMASRGRVRIGTYQVPRIVRTYGEAEPGQVVALLSSSACLEIAVAQGNAARVLGATIGTPVELLLP